MGGSQGEDQVACLICLEKANWRRALQLCTEGIIEVQIKGCETSAVLPVLGTLCGQETGDAAYTSDWDWATSLEKGEREGRKRYRDNLICAKQVAVISASI